MQNIKKSKIDRPKFDVTRQKLKKFEKSRCVGKSYSNVHTHSNPMHRIFKARKAQKINLASQNYKSTAVLVTVSYFSQKFLSTENKTVSFFSSVSVIVLFTTSKIEEFAQYDLLCTLGYELFGAEFQHNFETNIQFFF